MEVKKKLSIKNRLKNIFYKEPVHFLKRREINWPRLIKCGLAALTIAIIGVLLVPSQRDEPHQFHEDGFVSERRPGLTETDPTQEAVGQIGAQFGFSEKTPSSLSHLYAPDNYQQSPSHLKSNDLNQSMIISREGLDSKTQLPPGSRIRVRLLERVIVGGQSMPLIGMVSQDYEHEGSIAISRGSKIFGDVTFSQTNERASISWKSVQFPDGRLRDIAAIGVGDDGQVGILGKVHSKALQNTIGQTLTRFVGAYAAGSMQVGVFGGNPGGHENGLRNAVAETARDRADSWASDMRKEQSWIELTANTEFFSVLTSHFTFRDPGVTYGQ
jgi:hypothetical protein